MFVIRGFVLLLVVGLVLTEVVQFHPCKDYTGSCVIHEVRINPCPQAAENKPCRIRRRRPANISIDFTPGFDSETGEASIYWTRETEDLELQDMDKDACKFSKCPFKSDQKNTYEFELPISKKFPTNEYEIKYRLKGSGGQECCFTTFIKIVR